MAYSKDFYINQKIKELKELLLEKEIEDNNNGNTDEKLLGVIREKYFKGGIIEEINLDDIEKISNVNIKIILKYINSNLHRQNQINKAYKELVIKHKALTDSLNKTIGESLLINC